MTVDSSKDQTQCEFIDKQCCCGADCGDDQTSTTAMSTMMTTPVNTGHHFLPQDSTASELSARLTQIELRDSGRQQTKNYSSLADSAIPRRQPTIVCEDIADDIELEECDIEEEQSGGASIDQSGAYDVVGRDLLPRSASTASLTVPHSSIEEKRPPLHTDNPNDQMSIETTDASDITLSSTSTTPTL